MGLELKKCSRCDKIKEIAPSSAWCKSCVNTTRTAKYNSDPAYRKRIIDFSKKAQRKRYLKFKKWKDDYLDKHPCIACGNQDIRVLHFHHRGDDKKFILATA